MEQLTHNFGKCQISNDFHKVLCIFWGPAGVAALKGVKRGAPQVRPLIPDYVQKSRFGSRRP